MSATQLARRIKEEIFAQTGLTASAGISFNKFVAKLASAHQKPNGLTVVPPEQVDRFLEALPIGKFFGVGDVTEARFKVLGITTGADLKRLSLDQLQALFGKRGTQLYHFARGEDDRLVEPARARKSVGKETTMAQDMIERAEMLSVLERLAKQVEQRMVELELACSTVTLKLRWHDFQLVTRSVSLMRPIQDAQTIMARIAPLLDHLLTEEKKPVRLVGVTVSNLVAADALHTHHQVRMPSLWEEELE